MSSTRAVGLVARERLVVDGPPLDEGGEGVLFRCGRDPHTGCSMLFKAYKPGRQAAADRQGLERLIRLMDQMAPSDAVWLRAGSAWPTALVVEGSHCAGVLMPEAPARFWIPRRRHDGVTEPILAKVELLLNGDAFLHRLGLAVDDRDRFRLLGSLAGLLALLHREGVSVGDFSCRNLLFDLDGHRPSYLIDCDSMIHIPSTPGGGSAPGETPEWQVPAGEVPGTPSSDCYKFALLALRLFTGAQHHRDPSRLSRELPSLFRVHVHRSLLGGADRRPTMASWVRVLRQAVRLTSAAPSTGPARFRLPQESVLPGPTLAGADLAPMPVDAPVATAGPDVWHCRVDFRLNVGPLCAGCGRRQQETSLELLGPGRARRHGQTSTPGPTGGQPWLVAARRLRAPARRQLRPPPLRRLVAAAVGLGLACLVTFALVTLLVTVAGGPLHTLASGLRRALPVVYLAYGAAAGYLAVTSTKT